MSISLGLNKPLLYSVILNAGIIYAFLKKYMQKQKTFIICSLSLFILFIFVFSRSSLAVVGGDCDACHTIYQGMAEKSLRGKPFEYVVRGIFCVNCHTNNGSDTVKMFGGNRVPVVFNNVKPFRPLAGGNFYHVAKDFGDRKGHNVHGITSIDSKFRGSPPGYDRAYDPSIIGYNPDKPLACAGSNGCHGNRDIEDPFEAVFGTHHAVDKPVDGSTTAKSYRYLKNTDQMDGVAGIEDNEWNQNANSKKHNEYSPSINIFCASCHGDFHKKDKTEKTDLWFRHPTGITLPNSGEYARYTLYNPDAPVARDILPEKPSDAVVPGKDIVTCLSCHVAHSSAYESVLRWDYDNIFTKEEEQGGCLICHTGK